MLLLSNKLAGIQKSDLRPNERAFVEREACPNYTGYITVFRDGFVSTIAYRKMSFGRGKKKRELLLVKEIHRWLAKQDEHFFCDYLSQPYMYNDWSVIFCNKDFKRHQWACSAEPPRHGLHLSTSFLSGSRRTLPIGTELYDYGDFMKFMKENVHKYFHISEQAYDDFKRRHYMWTFAWHYLKHLPVSEIFCKIGYPCFIGSGTICNFDKKTMKRFGKWLEQNGPSITSYHGMAVIYPFKDIAYCFRHSITKEQNEKRKLENYAMKKLNKTREGAKDLLRYLRKQNYCKYYHDLPTFAIDHYVDYIKECYRSGYNIDDRGIQFPRDFDERLRQMYAEAKRKADRKKNREFNAKLRKVPQKLGLEKTFQSKNGFSFVIPTTIAQFHSLGDKLHICVGSCGYSERMANGKCLIIGVYKDDKPVNCVELAQPTTDKPKYEVLQNRGDHNLDSEYQELVTKDLTKYIAMANKQWRTIHATA